MEIFALFSALSLALGLFEMNSALALNSSGDSSGLCKLQGTPRLAAFSMDGDYIIGGVFSIHYNLQAVKHNYTTMPEAVLCTGRLVKRTGGGQKECLAVWGQNLL